MNLFKKQNDDHIIQEKSIVVQENHLACKELIESLFGDILQKEEVTDICYNGQKIFVQDHLHGRYLIERQNNDYYGVIKKIANYMLKPFSYQKPILDVSFCEYRLTATYPELARNKNEKVVTFSLRRITSDIKIKRENIDFAPPEVFDFLQYCMESYQTILISGKTGSGKTELQKFLLSLMNQKDRVILIEENEEIHAKELFPERDIIDWIVRYEKNELPSLVRLSLRSNPDWIIIAETRGKEAYEIVQSILSGHSAITTIHSDSVRTSLQRLAKFSLERCEMEEKSYLKLLAEVIRIGIQMERVFDAKNNRYIHRIREICEYVPTSLGYQCNPIYQVEIQDDQQEKRCFGTISASLMRQMTKYVHLERIQFFYQKRKKKDGTKKENMDSDCIADK